MIYLFIFKNKLLYWFFINGLFHAIGPSTLSPCLRSQLKKKREKQKFQFCSQIDQCPNCRDQRLAVSVVYDNNNRKSKHTFAIVWVPYESNNLVLGELLLLLLLLFFQSGGFYVWFLYYCSFNLLLHIEKLKFTTLEIVFNSFGIQNLGLILYNQKIHTEKLELYCVQCSYL